MKPADLAAVIREAAPQPQAAPAAKPSGPITWNGIAFYAADAETQDPREVLASVDLSDRRAYKWAKESGLLGAAKNRDAQEAKDAAAKATAERAKATREARAQRKAENAAAREQAEEARQRKEDERLHDARLGLEPRVEPPRVEPPKAGA